jgi:hypothetical protein
MGQPYQVLSQSVVDNSDSAFQRTPPSCETRPLKGSEHRDSSEAGGGSGGASSGSEPSLHQLIVQVSEVTMVTVNVMTWHTDLIPPYVFPPYPAMGYQKGHFLPTDLPTTLTTSKSPTKAWFKVA